MRAPSSPIAEGRTAEIYLLDGGHILKLYRDWCPPDWVEYEAWIARVVHEAGVPSPAAGEIVEVDSRRGLIYERIEGTSMLADMNRRPWMLWNHARALAKIQAGMHRLSIQGLPSYKDRLRFAIQRAQALSEALRDKALSLLESLPDGRNLCHGDYHPGNLLLTRKGPVVIDWMTACSGSAWSDVARTNLLLTVGPKGAGKLVSPIIRMAIRSYHRTYLHQYLAICGENKDGSDRWTPVIAAARLNEGILPEQEALLEVVEQA